MIKFFHNNNKRISKWNWIDSNNNFVGYDKDRSCCESFGYIWIDLENKEILNQDEILRDNNFLWDVNAIILNSDFDFIDDEHLSKEYLEDGGMKAFKIIDKEIYLVLYNSHNGYYCHGWEAFEETGVI